MRRRSITSLLHRGVAPVAALAVLTVSTLFGAAPRAAAADYVPISGAGSTWSSNAMDAWTSDVLANGIKVNFQANGSSAGRQNFKNRTVDFAVSEIPYGVTDQGVTEAPPSDPFAYMPIVAGGTSFMYNLKINGNRVTNLQLSGPVIAKIFTAAITMWNDPAIAADNPTLHLPAERIVPVVRSDGSGTTAQLTTWMSKRQEPIWDAYCQKAGRTTPCGVTSFYPLVSGSNFQSLSGSTGVSGFVAQNNNEGSITYVEYSYAQLTGFPVAKMRNVSQNYVQPTADNVAIALRRAVINADLTQELSGVYDNSDPNAYPLSSYSYMIVPVDSIPAASHFTTDKGRTLGAFIDYFLCQGQAETASLGYSPLPDNLVKAALAVTARIPGVQDKRTDCGGAGGGTGGGSRSTLTGTGLSGSSGAGTGRTTTAGTTGSGPGSSAAAAAAAANASADPALGGGGDSSSTATGGSGAPVNADPVAISATSGSGLQHSLMLLAGVLLGSIVFLPPIVARRAARRKGDS